jgi:CheY-like chemotaxis protein
MTSVTAVDSRPLALIVDADADTRAMYGLYLASEGIAVADAADAEQAVEKARSLHPDIITTDLLFSDRTEVNLCERLSGLAATKSIPVIAVTAWAMPDDVTCALRSGCVSVLIKPCLPEALLAEIRRVMSTRPHD